MAPVRLPCTSRAAFALAGLTLLLACPRGHAQQFVLFDATFTFTKEDADNSKPSKSHYYVRGKALNADRPKDWTKPVDYRNGTVHIRAEVIDKPAGGAPTTWALCYIPNTGRKNGYGCTGTDVYREKGVYEKDVKMTAFWENDSIVWEEGIKEMHLVMKDDSGGGGHAHKRPDPERFFPTRMRITMVQVAKGSTYDPKLVPDLPAAAAAHTTDTLDTVKKAVADGTAVLVDVREAGEWKDGHLKDARHLALSDLKAGVPADRLKQTVPPGSVVYLHCASGRRCLAAADLLKKQGYDARPLKDGYEALLKAGFDKAK